MAAYEIAIKPLMLMILEIANQLPDIKTKMAAYEDDFAAADSVENLLYWWETLCKFGPIFGYYPEATKSRLIVKPRSMMKATHTFNKTDIKITKNGKRHLVFSYRLHDLQGRICSDKVTQWCNDIRLLRNIAKIERLSGYKHNLKYCI